GVPQHQDLRLAELAFQNREVVRPVDRQVRLTLNDQRAAQAPRRALNTHNPLRQRADPGSGQATRLQRVRQEKRQERRRIGVFGETPGNAVYERFEQVITQTRPAPSARPDQRRQQDHLPLRRRVCPLMKQVIRHDGTTHALSAQVPGMWQPKAFGFRQQTLQHQLILGEVIDTGPIAAGQAMARQVAGDHGEPLLQRPFDHMPV
ncbi:hypothetical protein ALQ26_01548, partial [Pseudomonas amygdali pv. lachrymans]